MARAVSPEVVCHCDAVQGFLKIPFTARALGADLITVSAHKIHGPKGVGALFVNERMLKERRLSPFLFGGGQEFGFRSGTENMLGIVGFGAACERGAADLRAALSRMATLSQRLRAKLADTEIALNTPPVSAPHIVSLTLPHIKSETMLHYLAARGIFVSAGSACSAHAAGPSSVLLAFGLDAAAASSSLRISFSAENTEADVDALCEALAQGLKTLVRTKR
jgi:cysteine desulfurase